MGFFWENGLGIVAVVSVSPEAPNACVESSVMRAKTGNVAFIG
jgi:hypothetical protein